jgi:hypothetical protein
VVFGLVLIIYNIEKFDSVFSIDEGSIVNKIQFKKKISKLDV